VHRTESFQPILVHGTAGRVRLKNYIVLINNNYFYGIEVATPGVKASGSCKPSVFILLLWYVFRRGYPAPFF
jgi:hypothetical protein